MRKILQFTVAAGFLAIGCGSKDHSSDSKDEISGVYVREYSFKVVRPETGEALGMRTIRDSIFVRTIASDFEVSNHKWKMNDYDNLGWQTMKHDDNRPRPSFKAILDPARNILTSEEAVTLFLEIDKSRISWDRSTYYQKIKY